MFIKQRNAKKYMSKIGKKLQSPHHFQCGSNHHHSEVELSNITPDSYFKKKEQPAFTQQVQDVFRMSFIVEEQIENFKNDYRQEEEEN